MDPRPLSSGRVGYRRDGFKNRWKRETWLKVEKVRLVNAVNLTQSRATWEESLQEDLLRLGWTMSVPEGFFLVISIDVREQPRWMAVFLGFGLCV